MIRERYNLPPSAAEQCHDREGWERVGQAGADWEAEWIEVVQGLLKRDAGWDWTDFWTCIKDNLTVRQVSVWGIDRQRPPAPADLSPARDLRDERVREVVGRFKRRREWAVMGGLRGLIVTIDASMRPP